MYKVVIADDEVWVAIGIKKLIHRSSLPFEVVGEASNGIKALEMVREMRPRSRNRKRRDFLLRIIG